MRRTSSTDETKIFPSPIFPERAAALNGLLLKGDGKGNFTPLSILQSGIYVPGNAKALGKLRSAAGSYLVAASQNRGPLKLYELKQTPTLIKWNADDAYARLHFKDGRIEKRECYYGESFLSQSAGFFSVGRNVAYIEIFNSRQVGRLGPIGQLAGQGRQAGIAQHRLGPHVVRAAGRLGQVAQHHARTAEFSSQRRASAAPSRPRHCRSRGCRRRRRAASGWRCAG